MGDSNTELFSLRSLSASPHCTRVSFPGNNLLPLTNTPLTKETKETYGGGGGGGGGVSLLFEIITLHFSVGYVQ